MERVLYAALSAISIGTCLVIPFMFLSGSVTESQYKNILLLGSFGWFVFATLWASRGKSHT